ncbi:MAG: NAD-dependent epimerase/dehydratase family protein [Bacteroidia bacterium]
MKQRILLTGGTGLVGSYLLPALQSKGYAITALSRKEGPVMEGVTWRKNEMHRFDDTFFSSLGTFDTVIHNAACLKTGRTKEERQELKEVNIDFSRSLFRWCASNGIQRILFTSSLSFLERPLPSLIDENAAIKASHYYGESKRAGEILLQETAQKANISFSIFRLSSPVPFMAEQLPDTVLKKWISLARQGLPLTVYGNGSRTQNFIAAADIASLYIKCISGTHPSGIYQAASEHAITMERLARMIASHFGVTIQLVGEDRLEAERWNLSTVKARTTFEWTPRYDSETAVLELLKNIREKDRHTQ